jgi:hypothetical protein
MSWGYFHCGRLKASRHKIGRILAEKKNGYLGKGLQNAETDFECNISIKGCAFLLHVASLVKALQYHSASVSGELIGGVLLQIAISGRR